MTNDNDPRDDAMREIEAALDAHEDRVGTWATSDRCFPRKGRAKLLALIRSKLPQPEAEHERAVEAWLMQGPRGNRDDGYVITNESLEEALRLMRARPASDWERRFYALADKVKCRAPSCGDIDCGLGEIDDKLQAAGELLRAAKESWPWVYGHPKQSDDLWQAIAKAERAGIKP